MSQTFFCYFLLGVQVSFGRYENVKKELRELGDVSFGIFELGVECST